MKLLIVVAAAFVAVALAERCTNPQDCNFEHCDPSESHVACHIGVCTCDANAQNGNTCSTSSDCPSIIHCRDRFHQVHCVDGSCKCTVGLPVGK